MSKEDYDWRRKVLPRDLGCIGAIGLATIVCTGLAINYERQQTVFVQAQENVYAFLCTESDRKAKACDTQENLQAVYENATVPTWASASTTWTMEPESEWCARTSYTLGQCYDLTPKREGAYEGYISRKIEVQHKDDQFYRDLEKNNGM